MDVATHAYEPEGLPHHHHFNHHHNNQPQQQSATNHSSRTEPFSPRLSHPPQLSQPDATRGSPLPATHPPNVPGQPLSATSRPYDTHSPYQHSPNLGVPFTPDSAHYAESSPYNPMAAPPLPNTPSGQHQPGSNAAPSPGTPQSPGSQTREQQRIALLLEINVELLQEVNRLQSDGKGGAISPQQQAQFKAQGQPDNLASDDYIQCLRRVQANLGYLMPRAQNDPTKMPQGPVYMTPPPHMSQLQPKYDSLKELFPGWQGMNPRMMTAQQQQQVQQQQAQQQASNSPTAAHMNMGRTSANGTPTSAAPAQQP